MEYSRLPSLSMLLALLVCLSSCVYGAIPQNFQHTNLLRTIDLTKPYVRDSTALILENVGDSAQTEYYWGIPAELDSKLSYLEVKEKKSGPTQLFPVERSSEDHSYSPSNRTLIGDSSEFTKYRYLN
jgi:hypothetical protein